MIRMILSFLLSYLVAIHPLLAQAQLPSNSPFSGMRPTTPRTSPDMRTPPAPEARPGSIESVSDEILAQYLGRNGFIATNDQKQLRDYELATREMLKRGKRGDGFAAYMMGRECEYPSASQYSPNIDWAISWYEAAGRAGNLAGGYRLGQLLQIKIEPKGSAERGLQWQQWALKNGFDPASVTVPPRYHAMPTHSTAASRPSSPSSDDNSAAIVGAAALLGLAALLSGGDSAPKTNSGSADQNNRKIVSNTDPRVPCALPNGSPF